MLITKPMLAESAFLDSDTSRGKLDSVKALKYPLIASPKVDGIRCFIKNGEATSRSGKPIPNRHIQKVIREAHLPDGIDGELILDGKEFSDITSAVMSHEGEPDFVYCVFDWAHEGSEYSKRLWAVEGYFEDGEDTFVRVLEHKLIANVSELLAYEVDCLERGFEGLCLRSIDGPYKQGRSTLKQGYLLKMKRFFDSEAEVIGFTELMHNGNVGFKNEVGHTKHSTAKDGLVPMGTLGALVVRDASLWEETFDVGTGFTAQMRQELWDKREEMLGKKIVYKYFDIGAKDRPRHPVFKGFRDDKDLGGA